MAVIPLAAGTVQPCIDLAIEGLFDRDDGSVNTAIHGIAPTPAAAFADAVPGDTEGAWGDLGEVTVVVVATFLAAHLPRLAPIPFS
jgi:hypothetical protein